MSWLLPPPSQYAEQHVGAPSPAELFGQGQASPIIISSASVNVYLKSIAAAEIAAEAATSEAEGLATQAMTANDGYAAAFGKVRTAANRWRDVRQLALKLAKADDQQSTPEKTADMAQAKLAVPGVLQTVAGALAHLVSVQAALSADQNEKRPDLPPPAVFDPEQGGGELPSWGVLAVGAGIVYLIWKVVF